MLKIEIMIKNRKWFLLCWCSFNLDVYLLMEKQGLILIHGVVLCIEYNNEGKSL